MVLRLQLNSGEFLKLMSVYGPTMQRCDEENGHFYESLNAVVNTDKQDRMVVLGDLNARVGSDWELRPYVLGKHGIGKMNSRGFMLLEFSTQNHLTVMGSFFSAPCSIEINMATSKIKALASTGPCYCKEICKTSN